MFFFLFVSTALVGSLTIGTTFLFSPVSGILVDKLGLRTTTFLGGVLTCSGMFLSSIYTGDNTLVFWKPLSLLIYVLL